MGNIIDLLTKQRACSPPPWLSQNTMYLCQMGSVAYGVSTDSSDMDIYGFCMPSKRMLVKPFNEYVPGFDKLEKFDQWQETHVRPKILKEIFEKYNIPLGTTVNDIDEEIKRRNKLE